jgi:hypothetical protein
MLLRETIQERKDKCSYLWDQKTKYCNGYDTVKNVRYLYSELEKGIYDTLGEIMQVHVLF